MRIKILSARNPLALFYERLIHFRAQLYFNLNPSPLFFFSRNHKFLKVEIYSTKKTVTWYTFFTGYWEEALQSPSKKVITAHASRRKTFAGHLHIFHRNAPPRAYARDDRQSSHVQRLYRGELGFQIFDGPRGYAPSTVQPHSRGLSPSFIHSYCSLSSGRVIKFQESPPRALAVI